MNTVPLEHDIPHGVLGHMVSASHAKHLVRTSQASQKMKDFVIALLSLIQEPDSDFLDSFKLGMAMGACANDFIFDVQDFLTAIRNVRDLDQLPIIQRPS
jgi:hypothetical protein